MNQEKRIALEKHINSQADNIAGIAVLKEGEVAYEAYFNACSPSSKIHIYSVTKSIVSILIGIAIDKGYIKSIEEKVLDFFPEYVVKTGEKNIETITLKDIMTMKAPYQYEIPPYLEYFTSEDWVTFSLNLLGGSSRVGTFNYTPLIGPDILSGIIEKATGHSLLDFANQVLFSPLGITVENSLVFKNEKEQMAFNMANDISGWAADGTGTNAAGWGLTLSPMEMVKIGQLYLDGGALQGKQIVSKEWIIDSTREHSKWEAYDLSYGYLWWVDEDNSFFAMGDGGNVIYVNVRKQVVIAITSFFKPDVNDRIALIKQYIEPLFE